ncbi:hypothetical protein [Streptomyces puniciscabiei]|uniref:hypothetical protein n=1 Tax=Streptomyces puniciscabiei TaxID=164348 RepID=UPI0006EB9BAB|nr:hypothetical protein [Streptomyces puniciscabiei]
MFVADGDDQGVAERAFLLGGGSLDALCDIPKTLSDLPDLSRVERDLVLSGDGGVRVELLLRRVLASLGLVDPLGDDGGVGSGVEGCLVAGEAPLAVLDRLACLGLLGGLGVGLGKSSLQVRPRIGTH